MTGGHLLTIREAAAETRLAVSTLYKRVCARQIPFVKLGSRVLFEADQLSAWIDSQRVPTIGGQK